MKKIRTVMAYYNGEKFIDEQMQSIVDQIIPDGYEHEIYVYDDGSKEESIKYLENKWESRITKVISKKNEGLLLTFTKGFMDAISDGVDIVFFADQDDVYKKDKYLKHVVEHEKGFSYVSSKSRIWYYETNEFEEWFLNIWSGHRMSVAPKSIKFETDKLLNAVKKINKTIYSHRYHDTLYSFVFAIKTNVSFITENLTDYRNNIQSASRQVSDDIKVMWKDDYSYYFDVIKPFFLEVFNEKIKIKEYNKGLYYFDYSYLRCRQMAWMRMHWNNLWMHLRCKKMRNL